MSAHQTASDDKGYKRGAKGIDGNDGEGFVSWGKAEGVCKVTGSDGGDGAGSGASCGKLLSSAKGKGK